jgi:putative CocE/NonD family hydrolase
MRTIPDRDAGSTGLARFRSGTRLVRHVAVLVALVSLGSGTLSTQGLDYVRSNYTKYEFEVPMRDGVKLFTSVYVPKDDTKPYPILLSRTPYSVAPYGIDNYRTSVGPSELAAREGYIFAYQDVRGRWMSGGEFVNMTPHKAQKRGPTDVDESTDTYDAIDWLVKHVPNNNGRVGTYGISYPGFYTAAGMIDSHPAHKAASPQAPIADWFVGDDFHHNGALYLPHAFNFFNGFGRARPGPTTAPPGPLVDHGTMDGYQFFYDLGPMPNANTRYFKDQISFWNDLMEHETYDAFWQARNLRPHLKNVRAAVLTVGGWFDAENLFGALEVYRSTEQQNPSAANRLVMGPWRHGGWARDDGDGLGDVRFGSKTSLYYREKIELPFFNHYLKGGPDPGLSEASVFETGRNQWRRFDVWPPAGTVSKSLYFHPNGRLAFEPPTADASSTYDEFVSDPARPVPYISSVAIGMTREHMLDDQRFAARRPDVLTLQTDVLTEDVTIAGPMRPSLQVSTTGTDADWVVKVIDVYPADHPDTVQPQPGSPPTVYSRMGGYQQLIRGEVMRGKFRNSYEKPEPFEPGRITRIEYGMPDVFHTFRRGHRIMIQVQGSWFPLVNLNPQKFMNINRATAADFQRATQRLYRSSANASFVQVGVLTDRPPATTSSADASEMSSR